MSFPAKAWLNLKSLLKIYVLGLTCFGLFRLVLVLLNVAELRQIPAHKWSLLARAMVMGVRFDTVISCYILLLPVLVFSLLFMLRRFSVGLLRALYSFTGIMYLTAFFICCADIPFFNQFFNRLNNTVLNWTGHGGFGLRMILQEPRYLAFAGLFVLVSGTYLLLLRGIFHQQQAGLLKRDDAVTGRQYALYTPSFLLLVAFMLLGIRGRTEKKSPIIIGTAFFSDNAFINQVGLNPVFTFMRSWIDSKSPDNQCLHWISDVEAVHTTAQLLHSNPSGALSPVARQQTGSALFKGRNVVLVMMESMSAAKMGRYGCADQLTPYLDSLAGQCWSFDSVFSAGIHTYNGIYSTLFAHPALMKRHTMEQPTVPAMAGLPNTLAQHGYQTVFFTTHDEQFDNMSGFLYGNGMQQVIGEKDYPGAEVKSTLGVPDEYMFRYAVPRLTDMAAKNKPFLAAFMTASDHNPRVIPTDHGFVPRSKDVERQAVEYADWSIRQLMQYASQQSWYNNTMFVFVADHGAYWGGNAYDIVFSYHHIPLMIYAPGGTESKTFKQLALQTDVFPTVTSLLLDQYINNTLGIDLLSEHHPYLVFSADDKLACMNDSLLYVHRENGQPSLYKYRHNDIHDYIHEIAGLPGTMQQVAFSWLQTSQWMLQQQKTGLAPAAGSLSARHTNP